MTLVGYGTLIETILETADRLLEKGIHAEVVKLNTITPIDLQTVFESVAKTGRLVVAEDCIDMGCVGRRIVSSLTDAGITPKTVLLQNLGTGFIPHGSVAQLRKLYSLDAESLSSKVEEVCARG